ncbi:hypothetical protein PM082_022705 [Marasmius tenuissimus]|nr:hypothetical protein PM082_022705 [Marasmius tenuissimus]
MLLLFDWPHPESLASCALRDQMEDSHIRYGSEWDHLNQHQQAYLTFRLHRALMARFIPGKHDIFLEMLPSGDASEVPTVQTIGPPEDNQPTKTTPKAAVNVSRAIQKTSGCMGDKSNALPTALIRTQKRKAAYEAVTSASRLNDDINMSDEPAEAASSTHQSKRIRGEIIDDTTRTTETTGAQSSPLTRL